MLNATIYGSIYITELDMPKEGRACKRQNKVKAGTKAWRNKPTPKNLAS